MYNFQSLTQTLTPSIFSWDYFSDFEKIRNNTFAIKIQLNILHALLGEKDIETKFLELVKNYPETREVLPILIAVRNFDKQILDTQTLTIKNVKHLFDAKEDFEDEEMLDFFNTSGLRSVFESKNISNLNDYVFGIEVGLDSNARKNRTGTLMEHLVKKFIKNLCDEQGFEYKEQATVGFIKEHWGIEVKSDKSSRRFDFAVYNPPKNKVCVFEVNYYGGGGSKLKAVAGEFAGLYAFMQE